MRHTLSENAELPNQGFGSFCLESDLMRKPSETFLVRRERGAALTMAVLAALMSAIAVYTVMVLALSQARQARFFKERLLARNAADAGVVWAQQRLFSSPNPDTVEFLSGNVDFTLNGVDVDVILPACPAPPALCSSRILQARVAY